MTSTPRSHQATELMAMLRRHYIKDEARPGGIFAAEIGAPGNTGRRADLIWQDVTARSGKPLIGHEIKVSRADVLAELDDPTKSDPWQRYCNRWWLVVPSPALLAGLELPPTWGVLTPPSGRRTRSMTVTVPAPELRPDEQTPAVRRLAEWLHWRLHATQQDLEVERHGRQRAQEALGELREQAPARRPARQQHVVDDILDRLGGVVGDRLGGWSLELDVDDVVAALQELGTIRARQRQAHQRLASAHRDLRGLRAQLDRVLDSHAEQVRAA